MFVINVRIMIIAINESRVTRASIENNEYFLKIVESENVDANIYLNSKTLIGFFTVRFFLLDDVNDSKSNIIFLKFKDIMSRTDNRKNIF